MIKNFSHGNKGLHLLLKNWMPQKKISKEAIVSQDIQSYFQLARSIATRADEVLTEKRKTILIADDEPLTFELIGEFFSSAKLQCNTVTANNAMTAYDLAVTDAPDLIITDWLMPGMDGLQLVRRLKATPTTSSIPVIVTTGALVADEDFARVLAAGAVDYIRKPFDELEFMWRVRTALALNDARRELKKNSDYIEVEERFLSVLMEVSPNPIFFFNKSGRVLGCNTHFERIIDRSKSEIIGDTVSELLSNTLFEEAQLKEIKPNEISRFDLELINREGEVRSILLTCVKLAGDHHIVVGSITDVTEIVQSGLLALKDMEANLDKLQNKLDYQHQKLATQAELLIHSRHVKSNFIDAVSKLQPYLSRDGKAKFYSLIKQISWESNQEREFFVEKDFDQINAGFYSVLERICPTITKNEKRLCAYLRMNHGASEIARLTNKNLNSINVAFARLRAKLKLPNSRELRSFLLELT